MKIDTVTSWVAERADGLELRPYQVEAWDRLWTEREHGRKRALMHLATGLGKTSVAAVDVLHYKKAEQPGARILFVSHMNDVNEQAMATFLRVDPNFTIEKYHYQNRKLKDADITFATFQGLYSNLGYFEPDHFDYIIWDEAHHIEADTFKAVREHFHSKFELGLTATPERADGLDILEYFGKPIYAKSLAEGIAEGWLSAVDYHIVFDDAVKEAMAKGFNLQTITAIRDLFRVRVRNETIAENVLQRRHAIGLDYAKTIVFCQNTRNAEEMAELLGGRAYHSEVPSQDREQILRDFRDGSLQVIATVDMFNEGIDIPDARLVVFLRSTSSRTIFEQQLGRGLRKYPGKTEVTILDFVANVERIDFVKELGRHVGTQARKSRAGRQGGTGGSMDVDLDMPQPLVTILSHFEFEDQTIEILNRYKALKDREYLTADEVVVAYKKLKSVAKVADKYGVSTTAIYKHLKRAGVDTSGHLARKVSTETILSLWHELGNTQAIADRVGLNTTTIRERLNREGISLARKSPYTDQQILDAYERHHRNLRATERETGINRSALSKRLKDMGVDTGKRRKQPPISEPRLQKAYEVANGDIEQMVQIIGKLSWVQVYKALDYYGYLDKRAGPLTSALAAAAYYKYGTASRAAQHLDVSSSFVSRLSKDAKYIRKYKVKEIAR